jgi:hypothetical protein
MDESLQEREERAAQNQLLFREVNERIASLAERALFPEINHTSRKPSAVLRRPAERRGGG